MRATINAGDEVIYHEPCFVAYAPCIQLAGGEASGSARPTRPTSGSPPR
jgi:aminotransferase